MNAARVVGMIAPTAEEQESAELSQALHLSLKLIRRTRVEAWARCLVETQGAEWAFACAQAEARWPKVDA